MRIISLNISNLRNIGAAEIRPHAELNLLYGDNGAGKTSVLEALVVLAKGRSFRSGHADALIGPEGEAFRIVARIHSANDTEHRLGLERSAKSWNARVDGHDVTQLGELAGHLPLVLLEPNSHLLVSGPPEARRRHIDWGVFHVEHSYLDTWRRYSRVIRQRNAALKAGDRRVIRSLDPLAARLGSTIDRRRSAQVHDLAEAMAGALEDLGPGLPPLTLQYLPGWRGDTLESALESALERDLERGVTSRGPHRADLEMAVGGRPARDVLSRGEQKIVAAGLLLSQARAMATAGAPPALLLDDLASEFDPPHLRNVLRAVTGEKYQLWITATTPDPFAFLEPQPGAVFHVEHGRIRVEGLP